MFCTCQNLSIRALLICQFESVNTCIFQRARRLTNLRKEIVEPFEKTVAPLLLTQFQIIMSSTWHPDPRYRRRLCGFICTPGNISSCSCSMDTLVTESTCEQLRIVLQACDSVPCAMQEQNGT